MSVVGMCPMRIVPIPPMAGRSRWRVEEYRKGWFFFDWRTVSHFDNLEDAKSAILFLREQVNV